MPKNANVVTRKCVRNWKSDDLGNVIKPKFRMLARGFEQIHDLDVSKTFAVAVANLKDWLLQHLDVKQALI